MERISFSDITGVGFFYGVDLSYVNESQGDNVYFTPYVSIRRVFNAIVFDVEVSTPVEMQSLNPLWNIAFTVFYFPSEE